MARKWAQIRHCTPPRIPLPLPAPRLRSSLAAACDLQYYRIRTEKTTGPEGAEFEDPEFVNVRSRSPL